MKKTIVLLLLLSSVVLCSCSTKQTVFHADLYEAHYLADVAVPYADNLDTLQFDRVYELERDDYGRRHFMYETYSLFLQEKISIHLITQQTSETFTSYYPDYCYLIRQVETEEFDQDSLSYFKARNDWGTAMDESKLLVIENDYQKELLNQTEFQKAFLQHLGLEQEYWGSWHGLEICGERQLYLANQITETSTGEIENKYYLVVVNLDIDGYIEVCEEFEPILDCQDVVHEFREKYLSQ